jgi:beta-lactamase superfamily II metal-dependent hydrolase
LSIIKSYSVGNGDMFYIKHGTDNFSIIDCCLYNDKKDIIIKEILEIASTKEIVRFISTHPDEDHIHGLELLNKNLNITNFYCVKNNAKKNDFSQSFEEYKKLRDSNKSFYIHKDSQRKWMNISDESRGSSGINILWPDTDNEYFKNELQKAAEKISFNDISPIIQYKLDKGVTALWMGDLTTDFMEKIENEVNWEKVDILFAPHHSRKSGRVPSNILNKLNPKLIVVGEANSKDLYYYSNYTTITQRKAGDIVFDCQTGTINIYVSNLNYEAKNLKKDSNIPTIYDNLKYIGSVTTYN